MAGLKKRRLMPCNSKKTTSTTKKEQHTILEKPSRCPSPPHSGDSSDEDSQELPSTTDAYTKPSDLDKLLNLLGSGKESLASIYKTRKRQQEGKSDSEEDSAASESSDASDEEMDSRGDDSGYNQSEDESEQQLGSAEKSEESDAEYMETFDTDSDVDHEEAGDLKDSITESKSNFHSHLQRVLTKADFDDLLKRTWKDSWEIPAFGSSTSQWRGMGELFMQDVGGDPCIGLKVKLYNHWNELYKNSGGADFTASRERHFYLLCNSYRDILYCNKKPFYQKGVDEDSSIMDAYIMHTLNHIYRTRNLVVKNDNKLTKNEDRNEDMIHGGGFLDRGFTRPKVLLLLPFRSIALRVVKRLLQLTPHTNKTNVEYLDRFYKEFGTTNDEENLEAKSKSQKTAKPADHQVLFGGNISEEFMFGIKFTRGSIKLYSDFYSSDIIVASPVQLVHAIGIAETEKDNDVDYLSSIEILIMDHADIIAIQNWSHINSIFEKLNIIPTDHHGTDIMRVRPWYLDGQARFYRQTIILGSYLNPDINAVFNHCDNYEGKIKFLCEQKGVLGKVMLPVRQVFERFDPPSIVDADDSRFDYFTKKVFPKFKDSVQGGIMIFISSYFDYVRLRNFLKSQNASFCLLGEYTKQSDISRARVWFFEGKRKIMLYTERAHFYHRYKIRGLQNLIIYSLPERKEFYPEIVNMLDEANNMSCTALFSRFDNLQLERIVGSGSSKRMMSSDKEIFAFA